MCFTQSEIQMKSSISINKKILTDVFNHRLHKLTRIYLTTDFTD
jgi:hypothetical protein